MANHRLDLSVCTSGVGESRGGRFRQPVNRTILNARAPGNRSSTSKTSTKMPTRLPSVSTRGISRTSPAWACRSCGAWWFRSRSILPPDLSRSAAAWPDMLLRPPSRRHDAPREVSLCRGQQNFIEIAGVCLLSSDRLDRRRVEYPMVRRGVCFRTTRIP